MKFIYTFFICSMVLFSCKKENPQPQDNTGDSSTIIDTIPHYDNSVTYELTNIHYGSDSAQTMNIYLPANRTSATKVFVLVHGGGWNSGSADDFTYFYNSLKQLSPNTAIININYRLATLTSPGYPKQIEDVSAAIKYIQHSNFNLAKEYCMIGSSAGGHLAMLYSYAFDENHYVKAVCNTVGPADFTDPSYVNDPNYEHGLIYFVGNQTYAQNPAIYKEVSPALRVTASSPATISFYGDSDALVPKTQVNRLHTQLDAKGVYNEWTLYQGEGHGDWNQQNTDDYHNKLVNFIQTHFLN